MERGQMDLKKMITRLLDDGEIVRDTRLYPAIRESMVAKAIAEEVLQFVELDIPDIFHEEVSINELIFDREFLKESYSGRWQQLNQLTREMRFQHYKLYRPGEHVNPYSGKDRRLAGYMLMQYFLPLWWSEHKQCYKMDPELENTFHDTERFEIVVPVLENLPYRHIYVDYSEQENFFNGVFCSTIPYQAGYVIWFLLLHGEQIMVTSIEMNPLEDRFRPYLFDSNLGGDPLTRRQVLSTMQLLNYLCASNADIQPVQRKKEITAPQRNNSKMRKVEKDMKTSICGYAYGQEVRAIKRMPVSAPSRKGSSSHGSKGQKKRPHTRRAHWHHYRIGKGRKEVKVVFLPPTIVGSKPGMATVHKVK